MTPRGIAALIGGGALFAAWLATAAGMRDAPPRPAPSRTAERTAVDPVAEDVQAQAERLRVRLEAAPAPRRPSRNPFDFASAPRPERSRAFPPDASSDSTLVPAPVPPPPALALIGVAEDQTPEGVRRTAIISGDGQLFLVRQDEPVGPYRVGAIGPDAVQLLDASGTPALTLGLR
jgi:hypothetical protein